jgi:hypothetical protein
MGCKQHYHRHSKITACATVIFFVVLFASCKTTQKSKSSQIDQSLSIEEENAVAQSQTQLQEGSHKKSSKKLISKMAHPLRADEWSTRRAIMLNKQPSSVEITQCKDRVEGLARRTFNLHAMDEASISIEGEVSNKTFLYHWCFYQMVADLDIQLSKHDASLFSDKASLFSQRMKALWIMGRALDESSDNDDHTYLHYVRRRYVDMSQTHFGRTVEVIDPRVFSSTAGKSGKAAGEYLDP